MYLRLFSELVSIVQILYIVKSILFAILYGMSHQGCPISRVAALLSDTWTILIMRSLTEGPKRFCEMEKWLDGISTRTLTIKLKRLIDEGLIEKNEENFYHVTKKGAGLKIIEKAMLKYSQLYLD